MAWLDSDTLVLCPFSSSLPPPLIFSTPENLKKSKKDENLQNQNSFQNGADPSQSRKWLIAKLDRFFAKRQTPVANQQLHEIIDHQ